MNCIQGHDLESSVPSSPLDSPFVVYFDCSQLPHMIFLLISAGSISRELRIQANTTVYITLSVLLKQMPPLKWKVQPNRGCGVSFSLFFWCTTFVWTPSHQALLVSIMGGNITLWLGPRLRSSAVLSLNPHSITYSLCDWQIINLSVLLFPHL